MSMKRVEIIPHPRPPFLFDIETSGLDPFDHEVRVYGILDTIDGEIEIKTANKPSRERDLIGNLILLLLENPQWGGWNITEFDLSFISVRAHLHGLNLPIRPTNEEPFLGKYGKPRVVVPARTIIDLAYENRYQEIAEIAGVRHSLQSVAKALGFKPIIDMTGEEAATASVIDAATHCLDDLEAMYFII